MKLLLLLSFLTLGNIGFANEKHVTSSTQVNDLSYLMGSGVFKNQLHRLSGAGVVIKNITFNDKNVAVFELSNNCTLRGRVEVSKEEIMEDHETLFDDVVNERKAVVWASCIKAG